MSLGAFALGAGFGFFVRVYANGLRKVPLLTEPGHHVLAMAVGGFAGVSVKKWQDRQRELLLNELAAVGKAKGPMQ